MHKLTQSKEQLDQEVQQLREENAELRKKALELEERFQGAAPQIGHLEDKQLSFEQAIDHEIRQDSPKLDKSASVDHFALDGQNELLNESAEQVFLQAPSPDEEQ